DEHQRRHRRARGEEVQLDEPIEQPAVGRIGDGYALHAASARSRTGSKVYWMDSLRASVERRAARAHIARLTGVAAGDNVRCRIFTRRPTECALAGAVHALLRVRAVDGGGAGAEIGRDVAVLGVLAAGAARLRRGAAADGVGRLAVRLAQRVDVAAVGRGDDRARRVAVATDGAAQEEAVVAGEERDGDERAGGGDEAAISHRSPAPSARAVSCR